MKRNHTNYSMGDATSIIHHSGEQHKPQKDPTEYATSDWVNFSLKNSENIPVTSNIEWGYESDRRHNKNRTNDNDFNTNRYSHPDDRVKNDKRPVFNPYISPQDVDSGLREGSLYQGEIRIAKNRQDAYVSCEELEGEIYIGGVKDRNRAFQNDWVAVKLLDAESVWDQRKIRKAEHAEKRRLQVKNDNPELAEEEENAEDDEDDEEENKPAFCGEVVFIIKRPEKIVYTGTIMTPKPRENSTENNTDHDADHDAQLKKAPRSTPRLVWFKPIDKRAPLVALFGREIPNDIADKEDYYRANLFSCEINRWLITDGNPAGKLIKEIGPIGSLLAEKESVITANNINDSEFSPLALQGLPELPWSIPDVEYRKRLDLRNECVFSIDPLTAKDLDDALHIRPLENGSFEVGVHIADVSYFIRKGIPLDTEAENRGTSTYLADRVIPMLPSVLCEQLCSLNPGVDRLAFSVLWIMDGKGNIMKTWHGRTIIRSCAKLAYEHAQEVIEGRALPDDVLIFGDQDADGISSDILMLHNLSLHMRQRRKDGGSLSLHSVKLFFELDPLGNPVSFAEANSKEANKLIEEFMLCANISVAEKIRSSFPTEALLRRHEKPIERRISSFLRLTEALGLDFDGSTAGTLQESFNKIDNENIKNILLVVCIRTMRKAKYFCSGAVGFEKQIHYALNEPVYTHFTSPIRRYPDVIVHRMLQAAIDKRPSGYSRDVVQKTAALCNLRKQSAKSAQDSDTRLYLAIHLNNQEKEHGPIYKKGIIIMTGKNAFEIYIPEYGIESRIHIESLPVRKFVFDKFALKLTIYWKKDAPVTMLNEEKLYSQARARDEEKSDTEDENNENFDDDMENLLSEGVEHMMLSKKRKKIESATDLIPPVMIDESEITQCIQMFSEIEVRLQVNMEVSPPYINVYPLNPFAEKEL
ncbi:hypothetical protein BY458DRAFT_502607 [Sporodiniella umbellata]|nr:hypothetical protein BY458DRAFT_502607 [Sporodiniella umbellata]